MAQSPLKIMLYNNQKPFFLLNCYHKESRYKCNILTPRPCIPLAIISIDDIREIPTAIGPTSNYIETNRNLLRKKNQGNTKEWFNKTYCKNAFVSFYKV